MTINQKPVVQKFVVCSNVFVRKDGKYILLKRSSEKKYAPNVVQPFGGKLKPDEDPFVGGVREVKEEAGISVKNMKLEAVVLEIHKRKDSPVNWMIFYFSSDYETGEVHGNEEGEIVELTEEQIIESELFPSVRSIIKNIFNSRDGTIFTTNFYKGFESGMEELSKNVCIP